MTDDTTEPTDSESEGNYDGRTSAASTVGATPNLATANRELLERLRDALLASAPEIDPGLVRGGSLEEVEASFAAAKASAVRMREAIRREFAELVPSGSPSRQQPRPATAFDKIREGLIRASRT